MNSMEFIIDFEKVSQCPLRNFFQNHEKIAVIMNSMEFIIDFEKFRNVHCELFQNHEKDRRNNEFDGIHY